MASTYTPLPTSSQDVAAASNPDRRRYTRLLWITLSLFLLICYISYSTSSGGRSGPDDCRPLLNSPFVSRGPDFGLSEKSSLGGALQSSIEKSSDDDCFRWTNDMLLWQRTGFHFQPPKNWMNDPNGPMYYNGWYHFFYQYNPDSAVWGNITWGHAISRDLIHWVYLPLALEPDQWYDINGAWTGSATILPNGRIMMLYTGSTNESVQVQNLVEPADPSDPFLLHWIKSDSNPVLLPPKNIGPKDFRDPTTAWWDPKDSTWRIGIGSKDGSHAGISIVYKTKDFINFQLIPGILHSVAGTGMWECLDFYPVATTAHNGLNTSASGAGVKHVMKASMDDDRHDYYAIGTYDMESNLWTPDDETMDVGIGLRYDWGKFYASKTFFDQSKDRRILWGWIGETDSELADVQKGWASLQAIPRTVLYDTKTNSNLIQWPVEELESLRLNSINFSSIEVPAGSVVPLNVGSATQLDIEAEFEVEAKALTETIEADVGYNCSTSGGAAARGMLGPFGLLVLADEDLSEQTAAYFYIARGTDGGLRTHFCQDETRSSKATDIVKRVVGSTVPVLVGESLTLRILVDHSIVESFAQQGRTCITSRVYPTKAIYNSAKIFLFNNATRANVVTKSITVWEMDSSFNHDYPGQI